MAQIRQLASLLSQQQQQVLPPFLSQLHSPAPRAAPPPRALKHSAAPAGEGGGGDRAQLELAAAVCSAEHEGAARAMVAGTSEPSTPPHRPHTPPLLPPALDSAEDDDSEAEEGGDQPQNVSGSSDGSGGDA
jgi:hypothetical protein